MRIADILTETVAPLREQRYIAFHGTGQRIEQFHQPYVAPHFFSPDRSYASCYSGKVRQTMLDRKAKGRNYLLTVELDIQRIFDAKTDPQATAFYNEKFVPYVNAINARYGKSRYGKPPIEPLPMGQHISFVWADEFWRYCTSMEQAEGEVCPYDGMLVNEGGETMAIVPFHADQIKILKRNIIKFDSPQPSADGS